MTFFAVIPPLLASSQHLEAQNERRPEDHAQSDKRKPEVLAQGTGQARAREHRQEKWKVTGTRNERQPEKEISPE